MDLPPPVSVTARRLADLLAAQAPPSWRQLVLEWSQAGTQHSGRLFVADDDGARRLTLPDGAATLLSQLRREHADAERGAWLSIRVELTPGAEPRLRPNHDQRPAWNATAPSMLDHPEPPLVPDLRAWTADLRRHPRTPAHVPAWLAVEPRPGGEIARLRAALDEAGVPRAAVVLPGDDGPRFEGTVELTKFSDAHYTVDIADYGEHHRLGVHRSEVEACRALWDYVTQPMPVPTAVSRAELHSRAQQADPAYRALAERVRRAGPGGILTNLAVGLPYDRLGCVDGLYFFPWGTPWEQRSLPERAREHGAVQLSFLALRQVEVQAEIVGPWFDQPGGGIRFHVEGGRGVRELVRDGVLTRVAVHG